MGLPLRVEGVAGIFVKVSERAAEVQVALMAFTVTEPLVKSAGLMVAFIVPLVDVPLRPAGSVQM